LEDTPFSFHLCSLESDSWQLADDTFDQNSWGQFYEISQCLAAWHGGDQVGLQNKKSRVRIPPGCKVFRSLYISFLLSKLNIHRDNVY
jgi:hypothetical protein